MYLKIKTYKKLEREKKDWNIKVNLKKVSNNNGNYKESIKSYILDKEFKSYNFLKRKKIMSLIKDKYYYQKYVM